jgi:hypothetical protein
MVLAQLQLTNALFFKVALKTDPKDVVMVHAMFITLLVLDILELLAQLDSQDVSTVSAGPLTSAMLFLIMDAPISNVLTELVLQLGLHVNALPESFFATTELAPLLDLVDGQTALLPPLLSLPQ